MALGYHSIALVAGPPSPLNPATPVPATVEIAPVGETLRITWFTASTIYMLPAASNTVSAGSYRLAFTAAPPSPLYPGAPFPATVTIKLASPAQRLETSGKRHNRRNMFFSISSDLLIFNATKVPKSRRLYLRWKPELRHPCNAPWSSSLPSGPLLG